MAHEAYQDALIALRAQLRELDEQRQKIVHAISAIESLPEPAESVADGRSGAGRAGRGKTTDESPSYANAAKAVLEEAGKPLHIKKIVQRLKGHGWYADKSAKDRDFRNSVASSLERWVKKGKRFSRTAPATYGLTKWQENGRPSAEEA